MNKKDFKIVQGVQESIASLIGTLEEAYQKINDLAEAEQEKFDNMSEGLQNSERGQAISEYADTLGTLATNIEEAKDQLDNLTYPE